MILSIADIDFFVLFLKFTLLPVCEYLNFWSVDFCVSHAVNYIALSHKGVGANIPEFLVADHKKKNILSKGGGPSSEETMA